MRRLIIQYPDGMTEEDALRRVGIVVKQGRVSRSAFGPQFCFANEFGDGVVVIAREKKSSVLDSFLIQDEKQARP